ncbi:hypothetical protein [Anaeromassilibacillus senegalensis]|uniref:hypothetical protein n=1 Tax=Anaeromassilibacillus senegalensis TaxID=1673717 RepID=UPI00067FED4B|nr:hypothetical protein [Anaeromassilibacillus senegalensis]
MGTIAEKLRHLAETKTAIKNAITAKGVAVSERDTFRSYATKIEQIKSGTVNSILEIPVAGDPNIVYLRADFKGNTSITFNVNSGRYGWNCYVSQDGESWQEIGYYSGFEPLTYLITLDSFPNGQLLFRITAESANISMDVSIVSGQCNIGIPIHQNNISITRLYN